MASLVCCALTYILCVLLALFATVAFRAIGRRGLGFVFAFLSSCVLVTIVADKTTNRTDICDARLPGDGAETLSHLRDAEPGTATNDPPPLAFAAFGATASNVVFSAIWSTNVPPGSRIELHEKLWSLTNAWSPVLSLFVLPSATNWTETLLVATNRPTAAFYSLYADVLSISFPSLVSTGCTSGFRLSVATTDDPIPVLVERSERPAEFPPYDPGFAENPFADSPGLSYDSTNGTVTADGPGSFVLPTGDALVVISPSLVFGTPHDYAGDTLVYDDVFGTYSVCSAYPLDEPCLWEGWHVGTNTSFGCSCVPEFTLGADVSGFGEISNSVEVVDGVAVAKVFLGDALVWSNSCEHARYWSFGGRADILSNDGCSTCGSCSAGDCDAFDGPSVGSVRFRVSLGSPSDGKVSGFLWFDDDAVFLPGPSSFSLLKRHDAHVSDVTVNGVRTVVCSDRGGRTLVVSNVVDGVRIGVTFTASGAKDRSWEITRENGAMRFRKFNARGDLMSDVSYAPSGGAWTVTDNTSGRSDATVSTGRTLCWEDEFSRTVETVVSCGTVTASVVRVTSELVGGGDDGVIRETGRSERRADGTWATSHASYWDHCGTRRNGQIRMSWGDDRAWCWTDYDELGREVFRLDQRDGSAAPEEDAWYSLGSLPDGTDAFATVTDYSPHSGDSCHANDWDKARTESRYVVSDGEATLIARTWTRYVRGVAANGWPTVAETTIRACSQTACIDNPGNAVSTVVRYDDESSAVPYILRGETISETDEDGVTEMHSHAILSNSVVRTVVSRTKDGHEAKTREVMERDLDYGLTLYEATQLTADQSVEFGWKRHAYDSRNRLVFTQYDDGSSETNEYSCCRLLSHTDRTGARTLYCSTPETEKLYHAEEEVSLFQLPHDDRYAPYYVDNGNLLNTAHKCTQHFVDALGRETNRVTRVCRNEGSSVDPGFVHSYGWRSNETVDYPDGFPDRSVSTDARGVVTIAVTCDSQACSVYSNAVYMSATGETPVKTSVSRSVRGGGSLHEERWGGKWRRSYALSDYGADGCERRLSVAESSDCGVVTNSVTLCDFLGRAAVVRTPASLVTNTYFGAGSHVVSLSDALSGLVATNLFDELGEPVGDIRRGVASSSRTEYEVVSGVCWRVSSQAVFAGGVTNSAHVVRVRLTGLSDELRSETIEIENGAVVLHSVSTFSPETLTLVETNESSVSGTSVVKSKFGREIEVSSPSGTVCSYFDPYGRVFYTERNGFSVDWTGRNDFGDVEEYDTFYAFRDNVYAEFYGYDSFGNRTSTTNALGVVTLSAYDAASRLVESGGATYPVHFAYDAEGRCTSLQTTRDGLSWDVTAWTYDAATGLCTAKTYADGSEVTNAWTADGLSLRVAFPGGRWRENEYNSRRELAVTEYSDGTADHFDYDVFSHEIAISNADSVVVLARDRRGLATNETATVGGETCVIERTFDAYGRLESIEGLRFSYDGAGRLAAVSNAFAAVEYQYSSDGQDIGYSVTLSNGLAFGRSLMRDGYRRSLVTNIVSSVGSTPVAAFAYSYDALNRPVCRNLDSFAYNTRSEVASASVSGLSCAYGYDEIGNSTNWTANNLNEYAEFDYDADGNMLSDGVRTYTYDAANRLKTVSIDGFVVQTNFYDAKSRRVKKVTPEATHTFFYDGWNLVEERVAYTSGTTSTIRYYWGKDLSGTIGGAGGVGGLLYLSISNSSTTQLYVPWYDAYGNIMGYWDAQGNVVAEYTYDAFGKLISSSGPMADVFSFRYSTKYYDSEAGLYYYGYRFYSPELMRWITRDPIGEEGGVNLYAMCGNNLVHSFDRFGLARMLTGALSTREGRWPYNGEVYARNILRLVYELNTRLDKNGRRMFFAEIRDLVNTGITELITEISAHSDDVYIIAHGGIKKNGKLVVGAYKWGWFDDAIEGILPGGRRGNSFITLSSLGKKLNYDNIFGCYISKRVRRVDGWSNVDDYSLMYMGLYQRIARYRSMKIKNHCPKSIIIYEGENSGSNESTDYMLKHYPLREESYYEDWVKQETKRLSAGGGK